LNFTLAKEENKYVTLVMEDCEVAVNGVMTFEAASLIEFSNTEQLRSLYNCKETYTLFIAYIDNRFTL
jgi:hypothetical protein